MRFLLILLLVGLCSFMPVGRRYDCHRVEGAYYLSPSVYKKESKSFTLVFRGESLDILAWDHRGDFSFSMSPIMRVEKTGELMRHVYSVQADGGKYYSLHLYYRDKDLISVHLFNIERSLTFYIDYPLYQ